MHVTQRYAEPSSGRLGVDTLRLHLSTEESRPPVRLHGTVRDGLAYSRLMRALYALVTSNQLTPKHDRSDYFEWVQQRYLDELPLEQARADQELPGWISRRNELRQRINQHMSQMLALERVADNGVFRKARQQYWNYLYEHDRDAWLVLDPVISVHPDVVIFEAFSRDESSYGRVTLPMTDLDLNGTAEYGTTNIDFSPNLAAEIERIRSYRAADLHIGPQEVAIATVEGAAIEKKIDLPPSWVRGFLQAQSVAALPGTDLHLSPATLADIVSAFRRRREREGPRSLRFLLQPGARPVITVEPWNTVITEGRFSFAGTTPHEIRIWGRRRLTVFEDVLPYADEVNVRLLGTGLPSYWTVKLGDLRFDVGLTGWTRNDWSRAAQFDLLVASQLPKEADEHQVRQWLQHNLMGTVGQIALATSLRRTDVTAVLQSLVRSGCAMYDFTGEVYRWRPLFDDAIMPVADEMERTTTSRLGEIREVEWTAPPTTVTSRFDTTSLVTRFIGEVVGHYSGSGGEQVLVDLDDDGRVVYAKCTCRDFQQDKLRHGPCPHILVAAATAGQELTDRMDSAS